MLNILSFKSTVFTCGVIYNERYFVLYFFKNKSLLENNNLTLNNLKKVKIECKIDERKKSYKLLLKFNQSTQLIVILVVLLLLFLLN